MNLKEMLDNGWLTATGTGDFISHPDFEIHIKEKVVNTVLKHRTNSHFLLVEKYCNSTMRIASFLEELPLPIKVVKRTIIHEQTLPQIY